MMADPTCALILWRTGHSLLTVDEVASAAGLSPELVDVFVRYQLVEPAANTNSCPLFHASTVDRLQRILRLRQDLGVNLSAVAVILEMIERIEDLQTELRLLRGRDGQREQSFRPVHRAGHARRNQYTPLSVE
jgi:DNA-binding transcriptional MerR regulator